MNPNAVAAFAVFRTILGYVALALALVALAKLFGVNIATSPGTVDQLALVSIACKMA